MVKEATFDDIIDVDENDPNVLEMRMHDSEMIHQHKEVPVFVLSPIVNVTWLYLLKPFRMSETRKFE